MTRSFFSLCIINAICLTGSWILIALIPVFFAGIESLTTVLKSLIWLGFIMDSVVCFAGFMVVWLKVQASPVYYYRLFAARQYTVTTIYIFGSFSLRKMANYNSSIFLFSCILKEICTSQMIIFYMNEQLSNVVDGINNPVAYPVGPIGRQAMAGA